MFHLAFLIAFCSFTLVSSQADAESCGCHGHIDALALKYIGAETFRQMEVMTNIRDDDRMESLVTLKKMYSQKTINLDETDRPVGVSHFGSRMKVYGDGNLLATLALDCSTFDVSVGNYVANQFYVVDATTTEGEHVCAASTSLPSAGTVSTLSVFRIVTIALVCLDVLLLIAILTAICMLCRGKAAGPSHKRQWHGHLNSRVRDSSAFAHTATQRLIDDDDLSPENSVASVSALEGNPHLILTM